MSAILSADDLNDFISPGVACIKPVETLPKQDDSNPYEVTTEDKVAAANPAPAAISLTDCLACSGCVTSAEAVLVSLQSHTEVLNTLDAYPEFDVRHALSTHHGLPNGHSHPPPATAKVFVASISPQVRASIAATFGVSDRRAGYMIEQFLSGSQGLRIGGPHHSGFAYVLDTNRLREACLVLSAEEVAASLAGDSTKKKPVLTSACPGWICYAEKTHPHILPHLSALKSPQAMSGTLVKSVLSKALGIHPSQIWHLAIMPCFDKKLEASRAELTDQWWQPNYNAADAAVRDVDCVITSRELLTLAETRGVQLSQLPRQPLSASERIPFPDTRLSSFLFARSHNTQLVEAGSSGGYLHHILSTFQVQNPGSSISVQRGRNADVVEYALLSSTGAPLMKCARYYGFRNIQNLVRKLKPVKQSKLPGAVRRTAKAEGSSEYAYVEVMACPGGCTNGGGQIKLEDVANVLPVTRGEMVDETGPQAQKEWLRRVDEAYYSASETDEDMDTDVDMDLDLPNGNHEGDVDMTMEYTNGHTNGHVNGHANGHTNGHTNGNGNGHINGSAKGHEVINGIDVHSVKDMLSHWAALTDVSLNKLAYTTFREVESDVGKKAAKTMGDSERIARIAGLQGGGW